MTVAEATRSSLHDPANLGARLESVGSLVCRYGLVVVIGWIGLMKFTAYEAQGIEPLVAPSPLLGWMYGFLSVQQFSTALGIVEVMIALLIAARHWSPKASALGSALAVAMFLRPSPSCSRRRDGSRASAGFPRSPERWANSC
jgi:uncharacterized membrane protein YkgB